MRTIFLSCTFLLIAFGVYAQTEKEQKDFARQFFSDFKAGRFEKIESYFMDSLMTNQIFDLVQAEGTEELKSYSFKGFHETRRQAHKEFNQAIPRKYKSLIKKGVQWDAVKLDSVSVEKHDRGGVNFSSFKMDMHFGYRTLSFSLVIYDKKRKRFFCYDTKLQESDNDPRLKVVELPKTEILTEDMDIVADEDIEVDVAIPPPTPKPEVFQIVEEMPEFPGGKKKMYQFISKHLRYPEYARENNISGKVFVRFTVSEDGHLTNIKVLKGIGYGCDQEAVRVVKKMPPWKPGKQNGKAVRVMFTLPFNFKLL